MAEVPPRRPDDGARDPASERLDSWKEIAAYLKRDVTTVQRWEKKEGLPVHRKLHDKLGSVYAFRTELDGWWSSGRDRIEEADHQSTRPPSGSVERPEGLATRRFVSALLISLAFAAGGLLMWSLQREPPQHVAHLQVVTSLDWPVAPVSNSATPSLALSPDGTRLAYLAHRDSTTLLHVRRLSDRATLALEGTEGARAPFFSPDGQWLGYVSPDAKLRKIPAGGGVPVVICEDAGYGTFRGASWGEDGFIVLAPFSNAGLFRVPASGGRPEPLTTPNMAALEKTHRFPDVLPGAKGVIFTSYNADITSFDGARLELLLPETGERRILIAGVAQAKFVSSGHLVFGRAGSLFAVPFDLRRGVVTGTPVQVLDGVAMGTSGHTEVAVSRSGGLAYISGGQLDAKNRLLLIDRQGRATPVSERGDFTDPRMSPDGRRLLVHLDGPNEHMWMFDIESGFFTRLTFAWDFATSIWSPKGDRIAFWSGAPGMPLGWLPADGGTPEPLIEDPRVAGPLSAWSPDGGVLLFWRASSASGADLWTWDSATGSQALLREPYNQRQGVFSRDGRYIAYSSDETGREEIYVRPFREPGGKVRISTDGGRAPRWAANEIFYRNGDRIMGARVRTTPSLAADPPMTMFQAPRPGAFAASGWNSSWDVSSDGQRFVLIEALSAEAPDWQINVVINWVEDLKRHVKGASQP